MFGFSSRLNRIAVGKMVGMTFGLAGLVFLPHFYPDAGWMLRWGVLFWYTTVGAIVGAFSGMTWSPILKSPVAWWIQAPYIGAWMNFILTLFAYDMLRDVMLYVFGSNGVLQSPFWFVLEGAGIGMVIGFCTERFGGESEEMVA